MNHLTLDDLLATRLNSPEFALRYLNGAYNDEDPRMFEIVAGRVMRHAGKEFVDVASAMPYLRSLGFEPKKVSRRLLKPARPSKRRSSATHSKRPATAVTSR